MAEEKPLDDCQSHSSPRQKHPSAKLAVAGSDRKEVVALTTSSCRYVGGRSCNVVMLFSCVVRGASSDVTDIVDLSILAWVSAPPVIPVATKLLIRGSALCDWQTARAGQSMVSDRVGKGLESQG